MWVLGWWGLNIIIFLILLWLSWAFYDKRYRRKPNETMNPLLTGQFIKTNEIFIDPKDGFTYQVYFNPNTGEREYVRVDDK